ncbi:MAG: 3-hydroxyanthranilate 3,4-dioxygenase [Rhodospirillaceae bacterium]|jgi:3-hydroxyanthranilate 3,4-dioxygenase|nr:3-hydroxyanthranilate 3,4-dioxygenase [Alphaproteobacteria bacterium]MBT3551104.1 3-hydroxyanthranilate 3,4-dioxygenase [Rhodospirillaceae bacterium]MBT3887328.1 3-hydroxyanthranilate 3,4-dioxygenase [Rhodospirillaceae bacterium]MBT4118139.1 3-hydroxyanthranilate 3,4-dioxygenase [Rhodospirillaceae bacterium]MBT4673600.1 3-hydroxyanthranilate 3,4-dioxygenase [Rhodospirillaceae bacterium]
MADLSAFNLTEWIEKNRDQLKPPVGNARVLPEGDFIVMAIGGPNLRTDYHDDPGEEIFYQLEGDMILRVMEEGGPRDISIKAGDIFLLPANIRHSPQRPADSVGLVVERLRKSGELDGFEWFCEDCNALVHRAEVQLQDIYKDLPPLFDAYYDDAGLRLCKQCGHQNPGRSQG